MHPITGKKTKTRRSRPLECVLVKPAGADCNMRCAYCFYLHKRELYPQVRRRMSDEVLEELVRQVLEDGERQVSFAWQGGEPTLMGVEFFRRAVRLQERYARPGQVVANTLQTNGTLLDDDLCRLLGRAGFLVGLSVDGPADLHDRHRALSGGPSFETVAKGAERLRRFGVATNALVLLTSHTAGRLPEVWSTLKELGLAHFQLIPCLEWADEPGGEWAPHSISPEDFGEVLCEAFDL